MQFLENVTTINANANFIIVITDNVLQETVKLITVWLMTWILAVNLAADWRQCNCFVVCSWSLWTKVALITTHLLAVYLTHCCKKDTYQHHSTPPTVSSAGSNRGSWVAATYCGPNFYPTEFSVLVQAFHLRNYNQGNNNYNTIINFYCYWK